MAFVKSTSVVVPLVMYRLCNYVSRYVNEIINWYKNSGSSLVRPLAFWKAIGFGNQTFISQDILCCLKLCASEPSYVAFGRELRYPVGFVPLGFYPSDFFVVGRVL